ncbi:MAG TPA: hypothetical protein VKO43_02760 [Candidatus Krumholzibacteriaceae bacterium]|nr:hypothetical protein [Candidatus Krumholzibacteriaceae bacterium]
MILSERLRAIFSMAAIFALAISSIHCSSSPSPGEVEGRSGEKIELRFNPEVGDISKYKGTHTREMNFYGMNYRIITTYRMVNSVREKTEEGNNTVRIKCLEQDSKMVKKGETRSFNNPVKAEGRTIEVVVSPAGEVKNVKGFITGMKDEELKNFAKKWFFELPEESKVVGDSWQKEIADSTETRVVSGIREYTLEGIESVDGIEVACINGTSEMDVYSESEQGTVEGTTKATFEAKIALEGGYIISASVNSEMKGKITGINPETAKKETRDITSFSYDKVQFLE